MALRVLNAGDRTLLNPLLKKISELFDSGEHSDLQESVEGAICLSEDDPKVVQALLEYCYRMDYAATEYSDMVFHAKVYAIREVYDVPGLKARAVQRFRPLAQVGWNSLVFPHAVREVYGTTPASDRGLRASVVQIAVSHVHELLEREGFKKTVEEIGEFAKDLLCAVLDSSAGWREEAEKIARKTSTRYGRYICPHCKRELEMVVPAEGHCRCVLCGKKNRDWEKYRIDLRLWEEDG